MSASKPTPPGTDEPNAEAPAGDPSMEDILASIRRILSDDEAEQTGSTPLMPHRPARGRDGRAGHAAVGAAARP